MKTPEEIKAYQAAYFQRRTKPKRQRIRQLLTAWGFVEKPGPRKPRKPRKLSAGTTTRRYLQKAPVPLNPRPEPLPPPKPVQRLDGCTIVW